MTTELDQSEPIKIPNSTPEVSSFVFGENGQPGLVIKSLLTDYMLDPELWRNSLDPALDYVLDVGWEVINTFNQRRENPIKEINRLVAYDGLLCESAQGWISDMGYYEKPIRKSIYLFSQALEKHLQKSEKNGSLLSSLEGRDVSKLLESYLDEYDQNGDPKFWLNTATEALIGLILSDQS